MSTAAVTTDPYAAYGGKVAIGSGADPYAAYGGSVAPPTPAVPVEKSLFQKAKDNFNAATQGAQPGDGAVKGFVENVGAGGGDIIRSIGHALLHPEDATSKLITDAQAEGEKPISEKLKDLATSGELLGPGGKQVVDTVKGLVTQPGRTIGQVGTGAILGKMAAPVVGTAAELVKRGSSRVLLLGKTPEDAYESALKPSTTLSPEDRAEVIQTGLKNEIPISKAGVAKLSDRIDTLNDAIKDEIANDPNRPIDPNSVANRASSAKAKFANQVNAQPDLNAIEASKQQFLKEQGAKPGTPAIPPQPTGILDAQGNPIMNAGTPAKPPTPAPPMNAADAQAMKQGTYRVLRGKFGEQGSASVEAQKDLARGLKEEIATQFPEIDKLNATESRLLDLQPVLERAVGRISNHQLIGIGTPVAGAAAEAVTGSTGLGKVAMVAKAVLDNPNVKSRLAIALSKANKIPYSQAVAKVQAYSSALGATAGVSQGSSNDDNPSQPTTPPP